MKTVASFAYLLASATLGFAAVPVEWTEPETGHRVVRLSREAGSMSLYFHQNAFSPEGDKMIISTPGGLSAVDLKSRELDLVVPRARYSSRGSSGVEMGRRSRHVYYSARGDQGTVLRATHIDTKESRDIIQLPFHAALNGVNADETLIVGTLSERRPGSRGSRRRRQGFEERARQPRAMKFYSIEIETGKLSFFHPSTNWLNHAQCSPADPALMLYCHEGPWHELDRVWTRPIGPGHSKLMHRRTMPYEIAGHEFFSRDGRHVWYDLQTPRSKEFWLASVAVKTGERIRYPVARSEWSVHYNISPDGSLFAGDGGGPKSVANHTHLPEKRRLDPPSNGQWIYLFRPEPGFTVKQIDGEPVKVGRLRAEKLVDLSRHDYDLEPNVMFTPDGEWIVFRSNLHGERHVYAVRIIR